VRPGETLSRIAARYGVSVGALTRANGIADADHVVAGRRLSIPGATAATGSPAGPSRTSGSTSGSPSGSGSVGSATHTVTAGDTLSGIADRHGVSLRALVAANGIRDPNNVPIGTRLRIPTPTTGARRTEIEDRAHLGPLFRAAAAEAGVDAPLLMALAFTESRWRQEKVSGAGAVGVGQLLPDTAEWLADLMGEPGLDPTRTRDNVRLSARLLRFLIDVNGGDTRRALASYLQGPGAVARAGVSAGGSQYAALILERRAWFTSM
jgi:LysM repeat protein